VFLLCWAPFFTVNIVNAVCIRYVASCDSDSSDDCRRSCQVDSSVMSSFVWLGYVNSALNPIIYTIFNADFRRAFRRLLHRPCTFVPNASWSCSLDVRSSSYRVQQRKTWIGSGPSRIVCTERDFETALIRWCISFDSPCCCDSRSYYIPRAEYWQTMKPVSIISLRTAGTHDPIQGAEFVNAPKLYLLKRDQWPLSVTDSSSWSWWLTKCNTTSARLIV